MARVMVTTWLGNGPRVMAYSSLGAVGVYALVYAPPAFAASGAAGLVTVAWGLMMTLGAVASLYGAVTGRWIGEYVGMLPISIGLAVYAFASITTGLVAPGLVFWAFALGILGRWKQVNAVRRYAQRAWSTPGTEYGDG